MAYTHTNSKGKTYHLFQKGHLTFFTGDPESAKQKGAQPIDLPAGTKVIENERTGLPMVKKG
jgi:hypothetical protein